MKTISNFFKVALAGFALMALTACGEPVPVGNVGVKVNLYGGDRGVQANVVQPGRYWMGWNQVLLVYPTSTQTTGYCSTEGTTHFTFQSRDNASVSACIGMSYYAEEAKVPLLVEKFRSQASGDNTPLDSIAHTWIRQRIYDALNAEAAKYTAFELLPNKAALLDAVFQTVRKQAGEFGIVIENLSWTSQLLYPSKVQEAINRTLEAVQNAERAKQELITAEAQAKVTVTEAQAQADALRIQASSISSNPQVLQLEAIKKWNGELPTYVGNGSQMPFIMRQ
jgi:regulator of protease activity HflC (stomatin/prohibitin superfamily)